MFRIRKKFKFEAAHKLEKAYTKECFECIHGHSYIVELFLTSIGLNEMSMVLDFGYLKPFIASIRSEWDHALFLHNCQRENFQPLIDAGVLKKVVFLPQDSTAEVMACLICEKLRTFLRKNDHLTVNVEKVRVHETANGWGEFQLENK